MEFDVNFFQEEERSGFLVTEKRKKVWAAGLRMLELFDTVCRKYDLKYFVYYGTLLGAVRHQGFEPWDDDIDVVMLREDYEKFQAVAPAEIQEPYFFQNSYTDRLLWPFSKIRDSRTTAIEPKFAKVEGFHQGGAACTLKHFPGHGDTSADSHYGSVYVHKTLEELRQGELLPFQAGIDAGADAVVMGHLILDQIDDQPALFSYALVTGLLREEMGFAGVVITDGLQMQAMTDHYSSGEIAVGAVKAGVDILLCPKKLDEAVTALTAAVESGEITEERIDESVLRILRLKQGFQEVQEG